MPVLVVELASPSDEPQALRRKMVASIANGSALGWLLLPLFRTVENVETRRTRNSRLSLAVLRSETAGAWPSVSGPGDRSGRIWGTMNLPSTAAPAFLNPLVLAVAALSCRKVAYSRHSFTDANRKDGKQPPAHTSRTHPTPKTNKIHKVASIKPILD